MIKLKPCPCCGSPAKRMGAGDPRAPKRIVCTGENCSIQTDSFWDWRAPIRHWQNRNRNPLPKFHRNHFYVGIDFAHGIRETFKATETPEAAMYDRYAAVIGPFRTKRGADHMVKYGEGNPHIQCVADAERLALDALREKTPC